MNERAHISDLALMMDEIKQCRQCERWCSRNLAIPGAGDPNADLLLLGEAPGTNEDRTGQPFVGRAGRYLDRVLARHGLERDSLYITSILKCFHPKPPRKEQILSCMPWMERQIEIVQPKLILAMGKTAARALLQLDNLGIEPAMRRWRGIPVVITCHPAAAMRFPDRDEQFERGMIALVNGLNSGMKSSLHPTV